MGNDRSHRSHRPSEKQRQIDLEREERINAASAKRNKPPRNDPNEVQKRREGVSGSIVSKTIELSKRTVTPRSVARSQPEGSRKSLARAKAVPSGKENVPSPLQSDLGSPIRLRRKEKDVTECFSDDANNTANPRQRHQQAYSDDSDHEEYFRRTYKERYGRSPLSPLSPRSNTSEKALQGGRECTPDEGDGQYASQDELNEEHSRHDEERSRYSDRELRTSNSEDGENLSMMH
ncbi:hypothetical protein NM688_g4744 [Phlebia brevispora]|uniref:Uncharacterized protein n=1 Tax=Phlebia brevispora TaxID=194682 RepID=A0ACC1T2N7_9APHY|nr:hypothetical protein NM688_g4744 [Phlebia brevispora]